MATKLLFSLALQFCPVVLQRKIAAIEQSSTIKTEMSVNLSFTIVVEGEELSEAKEEAEVGV